MQLPPVKVIIKRVIIFLLACIVVGYAAEFFAKRNPNVQKAQEFLYQSSEVTSTCGKIEKASLWRVTSLKGGGEIAKGYSDYQFGVQGSLGKFVIVIRAEDSKDGERNVFGVKSIKKNEGS